MTWWLRDVLTLLLGFGTGVLSGLVGVGGAVLSQPGIRALGAAPFTAVGSTLPSILPGAIAGAIRFERERLVEWRVVRWIAPFGVVATVVGSLLSHRVPGKGHGLTLATAVLLLLSAVRLTRPRRAPTAGPSLRRRGDVAPGPVKLPFPVVAGGLGVIAGTLSGLLGVGGGVVLVPGIRELLGRPLKEAIPSSLVCVGLLAIPSTIAHSLLGDVDWKIALLLTAGVIPGAPLGATIAMRAGQARLRMTVAIVLGAIALVYAAHELAALR